MERGNRMTTLPHAPATEQWQPPQPAVYCPFFTTIPLRRILVPLSGTTFAEHALPHAAAAANATGASIVLVFVATPGAFDTASLDHERYLAEMRVQLAMQVLHVDTCIVRAPTVARGLVDAQCCEGIDLVVLATRPRGDFTHTVGGLAPELMRHGSAPVLLIPPAAGPPAESAHVLVPLDGSRSAECALFPLVALANAAGHPGIAEIALLTACDDNDGQSASAASDYLDRVRPSLERAITSAARVQTEVVRGRAAEEIVRRVNGPKARRFDMLAIATHGRGGCGRNPLGDVAEHVLPRAHVPVLVVNPRSP